MVIDSPTVKASGDPPLSAEEMAPLEAKDTDLLTRGQLERRRIYATVNSQPSQITANFERESFVRPSQHTRRRHLRKPPKDKKKGEQGLNNDEYLNRLVTDHEMKSSSQASLPPWTSRIEGRENVAVTVSGAAANDNNEELDLGVAGLIETEGMKFREYETLVMQVLSATTSTTTRRPGLIMPGFKKYLLNK